MKINKNTILKILIVLGVIAIIISLYIQYGKPYLNEFALEKQDQIRIKDLSTLNGVMKEVISASSTQFIGKNDTIYISLPSDDSTCKNFDLPSAPDGWAYHCSKQTDYQKTDGQGWLPVDFTRLPKDFDFESFLPIDPVNTVDSSYYYTYIVGENSWVLTSLLGSNKYLKQSALKDGGTDPARFEIGSSPQLWAKPSGLVGYWNFDEGQGTTTADSSGNNNTGTLINGPKWTASALSFDGTDDYVNAGNNESLDLSTGATISVWAKKNSQKGYQMYVTKGMAILASGYQLMDYGTSGKIVFRWGDDADRLISNAVVPTENWNNIIATYNGTQLKIYINGVLDNTLPYTVNAPANTLHLRIGSRDDGYFFNGIIDEVRIYNRGLSAQEVLSIYNATK